MMKRNSDDDSQSFKLFRSPLLILCSLLLRAYHSGYEKSASDGRTVGRSFHWMAVIYRRFTGCQGFLSLYEARTTYQPKYWSRGPSEYGRNLEALAPDSIYPGI